jgi:hypothetical protein
MHLAIPPNPNCEGSEELVFRELEPPRRIAGIRVLEGGREVDCDVTGVGEGGAFTAAHAVKIADSGAGVAFLIYGGAWGIRLRRAAGAAPWALDAAGQWGEPFKIYGEAEDIRFADAGSAA